MMCQAAKGRPEAQRHLPKLSRSGGGGGGEAGAHAEAARRGPGTKSAAALSLAWPGPAGRRQEAGSD